MAFLSCKCCPIRGGKSWSALGDVITAVDGEPITSADQLQGIVDSAAVGQVLNLTVQRGDRSQRIAVRTAELQGAA